MYKSLHFNTCIDLTTVKIQNSSITTKSPLVLFLSVQILQECLSAEETCILPREGSLVGPKKGLGRGTGMAAYEQSPILPKKPGVYSQVG